MPRKESSVMDERIRFVIRLQDGESMEVRKAEQEPRLRPHDRPARCERLL